MRAAPPRGLGGIERRVLALGDALRAAQVPVALAGGLDGLRAAAAVDVADRAQLRAALAATLVASPTHRPTFDVLFDAYFPARISDVGAVSATGVGPRAVEALLADLAKRLRAGDEDAIRALAREAVSSFGAVEAADGSTSYFQFRVFRAINPAGVLQRVIAEAGADGEASHDRLARDELARLVRRFRGEVEAEVRRRTAEQRGPEHVARTMVGPAPEERDFFRVNADDERAMRRAVRPLARRLATRLAAKRRRARGGRLNARGTIRRSLATGGVPVTPVYRARRPHRPELVLVCDVSGSVAAFAGFALMFCEALHDQFSRVRSFAFVDTVDEVTELFADGDAADALRRLAVEARVVWLDGHSDYGNAFRRLVASYPDAVTPRTTVLVLGDARNNHRASGAEALAELHRRAKRVYWLNPEPVNQWGSGDSITATYERHTDAMVPCRNLRQLAAFVETLT